MKMPHRAVCCVPALLGVLAACFAVAAPPQVAYDTDGMLTVNGVRTFILGTYHAGNRYTQPRATLETYQELREAGFNLVHAGGAQLDLVQEAGLLAWTTTGTLDLENREASAAQITERVNAVKEHPALAIYEQFDEPAWTWIGQAGADPGAARATPEQFAEAYRIIKALDPHRLIYTNHAPTNLVKTLRPYNDGTDIVAVDIYPVNPGGLKYMFALFADGQQGVYNNTSISQVGRYTRKMRDVAGPGRPVFMVLQGFAWETLVPEIEQRQEKILYPSYAEQRFMAFQSIINGANGLVYWGSMFMPQPSEAWDALKRVVGEVAELAPILLAPAASLALELDYTEIGFDVDEGIQWLAKEHAGSLYLFTCNPDRFRHQASLSGLAGWTSAVALHEDERPVQLEAGTLQDTWERFSVHVYRLGR